MSRVHPLLLSAVEVESLRQLRTRLNKPAASDAAAATLGRATLQVLTRVGLEPAVAAEGHASPEAFIAALAEADLRELRTFVGELSRRIVSAKPGEWRAWVTAGAPQAVIGRRLQLAGRERVEPRE